MNNEKLNNQQHQGEPVAWVRFRNGEPDYDGDAVMISNTTGDTLGDGDSWEPVYTHADSGEVEWLRETIGYFEVAHKDSQQHVAKIEAQLAERDALLRDLDDAWNSHDGKERFGKLMRKVENLAASAERNQCNTPLTTRKD